MKFSSALVLTTRRRASALCTGSQFCAEAYNITNTSQVSPPGLTIGDAGFGQINGTRFNDRSNI